MECCSFAIICSIRDREINDSMDNVVEKIKQELTYERVLSKALKIPAARIDRRKFLTKELKKYYKESVIEDAVKNNPAMAGISKERINDIAKKVINYETTVITGFSITASMAGSAVPGGAVGASAVDITQYFVRVLRVVQELSYLYGFKEFNLKEDEIDSETLNYITIFLGVMFGVGGAAAVLNKIADLMAKNIAKRLGRKALTKGVIYPIVKDIAVKKIGIRMTRQIFADTVASAVPIAGGIISGGLTFAMFKPCCTRLRKKLMVLDICDPMYYKAQAEIEM